MKHLHRVALVVPILLAGAACNAILGIEDLVDPGPLDAGVDATTTTPPASEGGTDAGSDAAGPCGSPTGPKQCTITIPQTDTVFPTWVLTSDEPLVQGMNVSQPTRAEYVPAETGAVRETHTGLTWQTSLVNDGGLLSLDDAKAACASLGPGWRLPTRIERTSLEYRAQPLASRTACVPPVLRQDQFPYTWIATPLPTDNGSAPTEVYISADSTCGLLNVSVKDPEDGGPNLYAARCVKGETKMATFVIDVDKDTVTAVEQRLVWERTGIYVRTWADANAHCNAKGMRVPAIQEAHAIIDTRTKDLFTAGVFVKPPNPTASTRALYSQTILGVDPDGGAKTYEAVGLLPPYGATNATQDDANVDGKPVTDMLLRCVSPLP